MARATPRASTSNDRSPTAFKVQGPVRVGDWRMGGKTRRVDRLCFYILRLGQAVWLNGGSTVGSRSGGVTNAETAKTHRPLDRAHLPDTSVIGAARRLTACCVRALSLTLPSAW